MHFVGSYSHDKNLKQTTINLLLLTFLYFCIASYPNKFDSKRRGRFVFLKRSVYFWTFTALQYFGQYFSMTGKTLAAGNHLSAFALALDLGAAENLVRLLSHSDERASLADFLCWKDAEKGD